MDDEVDLIVLGAGSGGVAASRRAAALGARVALVEAGRVGGTCVLRGCVPKKLLMYAAQYRDAIAEAAGYGWCLDGEPRFEMARWADAKAAETARLEGVYERLLQDSGVALLRGRGTLQAPHVVRVAGPAGVRTVRARHVLIATGGAPAADALPGLAGCATSDDLLNLRQVPRRCAVLGAGYIAVEFAGMLARLGSEVTLLYRGELPLRGFDDLLRRGVADDLAAAGVRLQPAAWPVEVRHGTAGPVLVFGDGRHEAFDWILNATGRRPNTAGLGLAEAGIALDPANGAVRVDAHLATTRPGHHAVGDVTDRLNLTPVAIAEGRALAESLFGGSAREVDLSRVATAVFTLPPAASIGPTEAEALAAGHALKVYEADFRPMRQAFIGGRERTRLKMLVDAADDRVLALHMVGADAPEIVQSLAVALTAGATKADFDRTMAVHPTSAEEFVLLREPTRRVSLTGAPAPS